MTAIDRDVLIKELGVLLDEEPVWSIAVIADRILALARPAEGITLTPEEAALAAYGLRHVGDGTAWRRPEHTALAARLEAAS